MAEINLPSIRMPINIQRRISHKKATRQIFDKSIDFSTLRKIPKFKYSPKLLFSEIL